MNATITISSCPRCHRPLAAVTVGASRAAQWLPVDDNLIDLAGDALTWCDRCKAPLPVGASAYQDAEAGEVQS